jgi:hypothetical protein
MQPTAGAAVPEATPAKQCADLHNSKHVCIHSEIHNYRIIDTLEACMCISPSHCYKQTVISYNVRLPGRIVLGAS